MEGHLGWAAEQFGVHPVGHVVHTSRYHSVGIRVRVRGGDAWLRVVYDDPEWGVGDYLEGNVAANKIDGVPKPCVKTWQEWDDDGRRLRGELSTFIPEAPLSDDMLPGGELDLSERWLTRLRAALHALAAHPVPDHGIDPDGMRNGLLAFFGISFDFMSVPWVTAHGDLHWGNVTGPDFFVLDWETWGRAPAGYDAATLYCASLLRPNTARRVHDALADLLDTRSGKVATLAVVIRFLRLVDGGEYLSLAKPLRNHADRIIDSLLG
jgi:hypothetical protein